MGAQRTKGFIADVMLNAAGTFFQCATRSTGDSGRWGKTMWIWDNTGVIWTCFECIV